MNKKQQAGLSLIELMVAMAISSFLILGVTQIYIDNKKNYLFQQGQAENQENGRFTMQILEQHLAKTGYRREPTDSMDTAFPALTDTPTGCAFNVGEVIKRVDAKTICIRFQPRDPAEVDCLGNGRPANASVIVTPYTTPAVSFVEKLSINNARQLICSSSASDTAQSGTLIEGIEDFRFDYGVSAAGSRTISSYKAEPAASESIRTVRYSALMNTSLENISQDAAFKTYKEWYGSEANTPTNGRAYQIIRNTVMLRNQMP
ncbi:PilW family protein [Pseudomonas argentinensis]|uniref:PilW family protein n=1 Tax=Phytopseudomonas argentinensis TaxID=289370 RepID=UPI000A70F813|nr:PilW family protein [Pseudomonas argentinensis]